MEICWVWQNNCIVDFPAWTQAIGSVLALFIAVFYPPFERKRQRKHEDVQLLENCLAMITQIQVFTEKPLMVVSGRRPSGDVSMIAEAYKQAIESFFDKFDQITIHDVPDPRLFRCLASVSGTGRFTASGVFGHWIYWELPTNKEIIEDLLKSYLVTLDAELQNLHQIKVDLKSAPIWKLW